MAFECISRAMGGQETSWEIAGALQRSHNDSRSQKLLRIGENDFIT